MPRKRPVTLALLRDPLEAASPVPPRETALEQENARLSARLQAAERDRSLLRTLIDQIPDLLFVKDQQSRFLVANRATAIDLGLASADELIGKSDLDFYPEAVGALHFAHEQEIINSGRSSVDHEARSFDETTGEKWFSTTKLPCRDGAGQVVGLVGVCHDITSRRQADCMRREQAEVLELVAMNAPLVQVFDRLAHMIEAQILGVKACVMLLEPDGSQLRVASAPSLPAPFRNALDGMSVGPDVTCCGTAAYRRKLVVATDLCRRSPFARTSAARLCAMTSSAAGRPRSCRIREKSWEPWRSTPGLRDEPTAAEIRLLDLSTRLVGIATERRRSEDRIQFMAHHDALTGLPNRTLLADRLERAILSAQRRGCDVTIILVDLDNFKLVNDSLGHLLGDELLRTVGNRIVGCVRAEDTVARLGGDEFVVILADLPKDSDGVTRVLQAIRASLSQPIGLGTRVVEITSSMGIASFPRDAPTVDALLANAEAAMYRAKEVGRDTFKFSMDALNAEMQERLAIQEDLRHAIARGELRLHFQPLVDLRSGKIFATESLVRWQHPVLGLIPPGLFIPIAEESGLIGAIGRWVLREACRQNKAWQEDGFEPLVVCVNVSALQFKEGTLLQDVSEALRDTGLSSEHLELELTESVIMQDLQQAIATMQALAHINIKLSIDDFGTGYSSLSALKRFPVTRLKIDRSFVDGLPDDNNDRAITSAVISMAHNLNLKVIAEGVETERQLGFLRESGCDEVQGFLISKPVAPNELELLIERQWTVRLRPRSQADPRRPMRRRGQVQAACAIQGMGSDQSHDVTLWPRASALQRAGRITACRLWDDVKSLNVACVAGCLSSYESLCRLPPLPSLRLPTSRLRSSMTSIVPSTGPQPHCDGSNGRTVTSPSTSRRMRRSRPNT